MRGLQEPGACEPLPFWARLLTCRPQPLQDKILDYQLDETANLTISPDIAEAIGAFWKDPAVTRIIDEQTSHFYLMDSAT